MSALLPLPVAIEPDEVRRLLGYPPLRRPAQQIGDRLVAVLAEARALVQARGAWAQVPVEDCRDLELEPLPAEGLVIGLVTAGSALEARASQCLAQRDTLGALLFDAAGNAAAEEAADRLGAAVVAGLGGEPEPDAQLPAAHLSCRISPGYGRWRLQAQRALFARLPHAALGVELTGGLLMRPCKSISFALWLGADRRPLAGLAGCARCQLEACRYRRTA